MSSTKSNSNPHVLLLQARRDDDPMRNHEVACFEERAHARITAHDLHDGVPAKSVLDKYDAVMLGGSGDYYASKRDLPVYEEFSDLIRHVVDEAKPMFAVCYGYHCMVDALGGEIVHDPPNTEVGTFELTLTDAGKADPLMGTLPVVFDAQMGHKDRPARLPEGIENLASSERSSLQALRIPNKPIWGVQFHPELEKDTNLDRFKHYLASYSQYMTEEERKRALDKFRPSPDASDVLRRFLNIVLG